MMVAPKFDETIALSWDPFEGDETYALVTSDKIVTARKTHKCQRCSGPIYRGERYRARYELNREDQQRGVFRFCGFCLLDMETDPARSTRGYLREIRDFEGGEVTTSIEFCLSQISGDELAELCRRAVPTIKPKEATS